MWLAGRSAVGVEWSGSGSQAAVAAQTTDR